MKFFLSIILLKYRKKAEISPKACKNYHQDYQSIDICVAYYVDRKSIDNTTHLLAKATNCILVMSNMKKLWNQNNIWKTKLCNFPEKLNNRSWVNKFQALIILLEIIALLSYIIFRVHAFRLSKTYNMSSHVSLFTLSFRYIYLY